MNGLQFSFARGHFPKAYLDNFEQGLEQTAVSAATISVTSMILHLHNMMIYD